METGVINGIQCEFEVVGTQLEGIYDFNETMKSISEEGNYGVALKLGRYVRIPLNGDYRKVTEKDINRLRGAVLPYVPDILVPDMLYSVYFDDEVLQGIVDTLIAHNMMCLRTVGGNSISLWVCYGNTYLNPRNYDHLVGYDTSGLNIKEWRGERIVIDK